MSIDPLEESLLRAKFIIVTIHFLDKEGENEGRIETFNLTPTDFLSMWAELENKYFVAIQPIYPDEYINSEEEIRNCYLR